MNVFLNKMIPSKGMVLLESAEINLFVADQPDMTREEWLDYCRQADEVISVGKNIFDREFFDTCPGVKAIALYSVGYDQVDIEEATRRRVAVSNTPDVLSRATSDVAFLLMQSVARKAAFNFEKVRTGNWKTGFSPMADLGIELYGKTLGVFGLGRIGYEMAIKCKYAFGMEIIYHNRNRNTSAEKESGAKYVSFEELLEQSDVLSIHANYSLEQKDIFNLSAFNMMKQNAILINTARGGFVNEEDLLTALLNGIIWGAGLDVSNPEPMNPSSPLLQLPNVCVLPHIGSATVEARNGMARLVAENIIAFSRGERLPNIVNREIYPE